MKTSALFFAILAFSLPSAFAQKTGRHFMAPQIMQATAVYVDCVCPRALAVAREKALGQLQDWGRFQIVESWRQADLIFLFSGNPYLGDYITRDGPDTRPVFIKSTIMTVIDPHTGASLWTDSRQWGSWRVAGATVDLMNEFREQLVAQVKRWTLNDLLMCEVTPVYAGLAHLTADEALARSDLVVSRIQGKPDRLALSSPAAPDFCKSAQLVVGPDNKVSGLEVLASRADDLQIAEVLQRGDGFDFSGGKYATGDDIYYFMAQSKDKKILIQFDIQNRKALLSKVTYSY